VPAILAVLVDVIHALAMAIWALGLPLLVWHRAVRLTKAYAWYAVVFVSLNLASQLLLGECFLTTLARACWAQAGSSAPTNVDDWASVRFAELVFRMTPSHTAVMRLSQLLILATAVGVLHTVRKLGPSKRRGSAREPRRTTPSTKTSGGSSVRS
jgi:hypothetical protein